MSDILTYSFSADGRGLLDLQLDKPNKQVYNDSLPKFKSYKIEGLHSQVPLDSLCFFEWQKIQYTYIIEEGHNFIAPFELIINSRREKTSIKKENLHLLIGTFAFNDQVGDTRIEIKDAANRLIFGLEAEVFPQKMDYKSDYKAMMSEIALIIQNLAFDSLKDTFKRSRARVTGVATKNEWWNILDALFEQIVQNIYVIKRQPKHEIRTREVVLPIEKIKQASKKNVEWFRKNAKHSNDKGVGFKISSENAYSRALSAKKYVTYDTYENRFIKWAVKNIIEQIRRYKKHIGESSEKSDYSPLITRMNYYQSRLQSFLHESPFSEVSEFEKRSYFSTSLTHGAGYRDLMHVYLLLLRGLEIAENEIFKIEQKNISTLYEYWCFLKLVQLLKEQTGSEMEYQNLIQIKANKFVIELKKGDESKVKFRNPHSKTVTSIYFNKEFGKAGRHVFTFNQRPDYSIEFKKDGYKNSFWYLFDAKYRFDERTEGGDQNYSVPQDAIGQLHRYRDAILHSKLTETPYRKAIKNLGGIILYPYPLSEEAFLTNNYFHSIKEVNIGAMPFLPSKTGLVNNLLNELITKLPEEHFENFIEMDRSEYEENQSKWNEWITIGTIPKTNIEQRRSFINDKNIYHIPFVRNTNSRLYLSKSILLYDSISQTAELCKIKDWEICTNVELEQKGVTWQLNHSKYIIFNLTERHLIEIPGKIGSIRGYQYTTPLGLEKYRKTKNKNYFYITNPDAARLLNELSSTGTACDIAWKNDLNDPSLIQFAVGSLKILSSNIFKPLHFEVNGVQVSLSEVLNIAQSRDLSN
ncbi:DUF2357 domain-containing protein [Mucilaginibacter sp. OK098]|uniref:DUF2357 domain-containing protein n=1 Tax=Mucilaginibacter sp. OK098 TaxID=1855297 RepID=UPI0009180A51|nr:DUF2357 domain-containing protein [Mucilaginibacter sp. OK098]SHN31223.1 PD-(D/E)XK nuclease superfamily protein [Mucilaginibacter sp. OK098]